MRHGEDREEFKEAVKEAVREWLDDQFAAFGRWTAIGIASGLFAVIFKIVFISGEWPK